MGLRRAVALWLAILVVAVLAMVLTGCSNILDMAEGLVMRGEVVAESAEGTSAPSAQSEYLAEVKADTTLAAVAAVQGLIEQRWGLRLTAEDLSTLSSAVAAVQDALGARALDSEAEALRRLEDTLRALGPLPD